MQHKLHIVVVVGFVVIIDMTANIVSNEMQTHSIVVYRVDGTRQDVTKIKIKKIYYKKVPYFVVAIIAKRLRRS